jgi:hypothetical protein
MSAMGGKRTLADWLVRPLMMSVLIPLVIIAFFATPFAISGFRRAWRGAAIILVLWALYTAYAWLRPLPADIQETDRLGANAWRMILLILWVAAAAAYASGFALSFLRSHRSH